MAEPLPTKLTDDTSPSIILLVREWNQICRYLAEQPFKVIAPLMSKMQAQALAYGQPPPPATPSSGAVVEGDEHGLAN